MSFDNIGLLVNDLLEQFVCKENNEIDKASVVSEKIDNKLKTNFQSVLSPEMKIQKGEEDKEVKTTPKSTDVSTPLNRLEEFYETEKETFLKTALTINQTNLETATDAADADCEALFEEKVNPTPGYIIDDKIIVDTQFEFQNSNLDTSFKISNSLKNKRFIYLFIYFPQPSNDNRKDFEVGVTGDNLIIFKSPTLNYVGVTKEEFKEFFDKIIRNLDLNLKETLMPEEDKIIEKQKITIVKNINQRFSSMKKTDIEQQFKSHQWLNQLIEDQIKLNKTKFQY